ncbi:MAG TPA: insulinase family protein, partial [Longimicrobium sp.]|nr:insulinase family protein [Longimicrobium sp.]
AAGDVTLAEVVALAEAHFGDWEGAPPPSAAPVPENRVAQTTVFLADRPGSVQSEVRLGHVGIERTAEDFFDVTVMNAILGGTFSSRLNLNLREKLGYTYGITSGFSTRKLPGTFAVASALQSEGTAHSVSEILRQMREMQDDLVTPAELDDARNYLAGIFPLGLQTTDGLAGRLSTIAVYGFPLDYFDHYRDRLLAVTAADVREAARRRLMPGRAAVVVVGDASALRQPLEELGVGPVELVDTAGILK